MTSSTSPQIFTVGVGEQYSTLNSAIAAAHAAGAQNVAFHINAGTYHDDGGNLTGFASSSVEGVGGMAYFVNPNYESNGKGTLVINGDVTLKNLDISGTRVSSGNGAAVRYEGGNLTVDNVRFHHNENGILANSDPNGTITITNSEFDHNGNGSGQTHNLYIGEIRDFTLKDSYSHDADVGHEVKSRALNTTIINNRILDNNADSSYSIDLPNGGNALIKGNIIEQGARVGNGHIIAYGAEGHLHDGKSVTLADNVIVNDKGGFVQLLMDRGGAVVASSGNTLYGIGSWQLGTNDVGFTYAHSRPVTLTTGGGTGANNTAASTPFSPEGNDVLVLKLSEDAYNGHAQFLLTLDGQQMGSAQEVTAVHRNGATQEFRFQGSFGAGPHRVEISFLNDDYGGTRDTDRNLYVDGVSFNGSAIEGATAMMLSAGSIEFTAFNSGNTAAPTPEPELAPEDVQIPTPIRNDVVPIDLSNLSGVDKLYYLNNNIDVLAARMDAKSHYDNFGWREDRDPNAFFDTSGYLATYSDVTAAGVNPLQHYLSFGWTEGRDPSVQFDGDAYLAGNADVQAAGLNPLLHYLTFGRAEGREAFADGTWT